MSFSRSGPCDAARLLISARDPTNVSRQPRLPQRQIGPFSSIVTWPISPAVPVEPRNTSPLITMPAPTPYENFR
jgi:hypothetical protein